VPEPARRTVAARISVRTALMTTLIAAGPLSTSRSARQRAAAGTPIAQECGVTLGMSSSERSAPIHGWPKSVQLRAAIVGRRCAAQTPGCNAMKRTEPELLAGPLAFLDQTSQTWTGSRGRVGHSGPVLRASPRHLTRLLQCHRHGWRHNARHKGRIAAPRGAVATRACGAIRKTRGGLRARPRAHLRIPSGWALTSSLGLANRWGRAQEKHRGDRFLFSASPFSRQQVTSRVSWPPSLSDERASLHATSMRY